MRIHIEGQGKQGKAQELIHDENWSMILLQSDMSMWFHHLLKMWAWNSSSFAKFCLIWLEEVERITPSLFGAKECLRVTIVCRLDHDTPSTTPKQNTKSALSSLRALCNPANDEMIRTEFFGLDCQGGFGHW